MYIAICMLVASQMDLYDIWTMDLQLFILHTELANCLVSLTSPSPRLHLYWLNMSQTLHFAQGKESDELSSYVRIVLS